jgi:glutamine synthetase
VSRYTLGIDTSNYATSLAVFDTAGEVVCAKKRFLPVKEGQLGLRQSDALWEFMQNDHLRERLGERFCHVFHACKHDELLQFERLITETEIEWMLKNA